MTEEQAVAQEGVDTQEQQAGFNPFDDNSWVETTPTDAPQGSTETAAQATAAPAEEPKRDETSAPDFSGFVKETFGFESVDEIKSVIDEYKVLKSTPKTEVEFQSDFTKNLYKALLEGKESEVYQFLSEKQKVERLASLEINSANAGLEILAAKMQAQYKDLTPDEIEYKLSKQYSIPEKPEQGEFETEEEYEAKLSKWQREKSLVEKEIMIDAKLAKPEIEKLKGELVLPDVFKNNEAPAQQKQEVEVDPQVRQKFLETLEKEYNLFDGFKVTAKDEDVEVAVAYAPTADEKLALKAELENFNADEFLGSLWIDENSKFNTQQAMADLYLLKNKERVFQKIANEAVAQFKVGLIKAKKNINLTSTSGGAYTGANSSQNEIPVEVLNHIWDNA